MPAICLARVYSRLGDTTTAIEWLEAAFAERNGEMVFLEQEIAGAADGDPLRGNWLTSRESGAARQHAPADRVVRGRSSHRRDDDQERAYDESFDEQGIREAITYYAEGMRTGDVETLKRGFHEQAILCGYLGDDFIAGADRRAV